jgi:hypothetical protein
MHLAVLLYSAGELRGFYSELISHPVQNLIFKPRFAQLIAFIAVLLYAAEALSRRRSVSC